MASRLCGFRFDGRGVIHNHLRAYRRSLRSYQAHAPERPLRCRRRRDALKFEGRAKISYPWPVVLGVCCSQLRLPGVPPAWSKSSFRPAWGIGKRPKLGIFQLTLIAAPIERLSDHHAGPATSQWTGGAQLVEPGVRAVSNLAAASRHDDERVPRSHCRVKAKARSSGVMIWAGVGLVLGPPHGVALKRAPRPTE